jgi:hypothetical protein
MKSELTRIAATLVTGGWASACAEDWPARPTAKAAAAAAARDRDRRHDLAHRLVHLKQQLGTLVYLASPYSHDDVHVRRRRYYLACKATAAIMRQGKLVYSPIVHSHPLTRYGLPTDWGYWQQLDEAMLVRCQELWVLLLDGWVASDGVQAEIQLAERRGLPRRYVRLEDLLDAEHPAGCVCTECEERGVQTAIDEKGGYR